MFDRRYALMGGALYAAAIGAVAGGGKVLLVIVVVGGPITGMLYAFSSRRRGDGRRDCDRD